MHLKDSMQAMDILCDIKGKINGFEVISGNLDQVFMTLVDSNKEADDE